MRGDTAGIMIDAAERKGETGERKLLLRTNLILSQHPCCHQNSSIVLNIIMYIHPSICPSFTAYLGSGRGGSSLSGEAQTSLSPATLSGSSGGILRRFQASRETQFSSIFWVFPGASCQWDVP